MGTPIQTGDAQNEPEESTEAVTDKPNPAVSAVASEQESETTHTGTLTNQTDSTSPPNKKPKDASKKGSGLFLLLWIILAVLAAAGIAVAVWYYGCREPLSEEEPYHQYSRHERSHRADV